MFVDVPSDAKGVHHVHCELSESVIYIVAGVLEGLLEGLRPSAFRLDRASVPRPSSVFATGEIDTLET